MKRKGILAVIGVLLVIGAFFGAKKIIANKKKEKPKVEKVVRTAFIELAKNTTVPINISSNGNLKAKRRLELYAEVGGVFKPGNKLFKKGQSYSKNESIIRIDNSEFYASVKSSKSKLFNLITSIMPDLKIDYPDAFKKWNYFFKL